MAEIEAQRAAALGQLTGDVAGIATEAASQVVQRPLDAGAQRAVVDEYVNQAITAR
jgi:F0F1-type ATP synthase membrane subunit b/b'